MSNHKEKLSMGEEVHVSLSTPVIESEYDPTKEYKYTQQFVISKEDPILRFFVATPARGIVRMEWALSRFGQVIPCNWASLLHFQYLDIFAPIGYGIADAQNLCVDAFLKNGAEWLFLHEDDVILPPQCFLILNEYMREKKVPIVSGLYFTKSQPAEPIIYRGRGTSYYSDWKLGDKVWCDGIPTGCLLVHHSIMKAAWNEAPEVTIQGTYCRQVFKFPERILFDPDLKTAKSEQGTSDLEFCTRLKKDKLFEKAGWPEYQEKEWPLLVDTNIFCKHITQDGIKYPLGH